MWAPSMGDRKTPPRQETYGKHFMDTLPNSTDQKSGNWCWYPSAGVGDTTLYRNKVPHNFQVKYASYIPVNSYPMNVREIQPKTSL